MPEVSFKHYVPSPPLSRFVGLFWFWRGYDQPAGRERCLPSGTTELVISLRNQTNSGAVISGARADSFILERSCEEHLFGIHFLPGGAFPFLGVPAIELEGQELTLEDLWPGESEKIRNLLLEAKDVDQGFRVMERWLLSKLKLPLAHHPAVHFALRRLERTHDSKTSLLAEEAGLSQRRFIEIFKNQVGLSPKLFGRVIRFQKVIKKIQLQNEIDWSDLAFDEGYFDQAHFNHDFKEFSGLKPTDYLTKRTEHLNHLKF